MPDNISPPSEAGQLFAIGDLAEEFGISPRAIRFYEDQGLLAPRRIGGNRIFTPRDRARLRLILRGKRLGFALADIGEMLDLYDVDGEHLEQLRVTLDKGRRRIADLETQLHEITVALWELRDIEIQLQDAIARKEAAAGTKGRAP
jgi:DNA-binding transcriptional MerR regulator